MSFLPQQLKAKILPCFTLLNLAFASPLAAVNFEEQIVDERQFVAIAVPFAYQDYYLTIVEQIPGKKQCWGESGTTPVRVNPLLLDFDFTDSCKRSTDINGYSIRIDGQDKNIVYALSFVKRDNEVLLVAIPRIPQAEELIIGRTYGLDKGYLKIFLNPGWRLTKRVYDNKTLEHVYISGDSRIFNASKNTSKF